MSNKKTAWDKARNWVFGGGGAIAFILFMGFIDWRIGVKIADSFTENLSGTVKIVAMDTSIAFNKRTGEENAEDIEQGRRADELAMYRLLGIIPPLPPEDDE